jgi:hypothetical protein
LEYLPKDLIIHIIAPYCEPCLDDYKEQISYLKPFTFEFDSEKGKLHFASIYDRMTENGRIKMFRWRILWNLNSSRENRNRARTNARNLLLNRNKFYKI